MKNQFRLIGIALFAVSFGVFLENPGASFIHAAEDKAVTDDVQKIAASIKNANNPAGKKQVAALAGKITDLGDVMDVFKPRKKDGKGGIGVGNGGIAPDGIAPDGIAPDGIQNMLNDLELGKFGPGAINKNSAALEEMGYHIVAMAQVTEAKPPMKFVGKQTLPNWLKWSNEVRDGAAEMAKAAKAKKPADVKTVAGKINAACNNCHTDFR